MAELSRYLDEKLKRIDKSIARLEAGLAALTKKLEASNHEKAKSFLELSSILRGVHNYFDEQTDILVDELDAIVQTLGDTNQRVSTVEHKLFPNIVSDLRRVKKLIGPGDKKASHPLDRRKPKKSK